MSNNSNTKLNTGIVPRISCGGDFKSIVTKSTIFVDKSLFIKEAIENPAEVILITMPRRTGKSANMDMLKRFLSIDNDVNFNQKLFQQAIKTLPDGTTSQLDISKTTLLINDEEKIGKCNEVNALELQGKYPVISIDFKSCKGDSLEKVKSKLKDALQICFNNHSYLKNSNKLNEEEKQEFSIYSGVQSCEQLSEKQIHKGIRYLSELLYKHHGKKVWILIDEYDAAANKAYREFADFDEAQKTADLFRSVFEPALKGNEYLEKGILTGVQYIVKSGILSGLNNLENYNINSRFSQYYGVNQQEMELLFNHFNIENSKRTKIKYWYNGYLAKIPYTEKYIDKYNIWSIVRYLNNQDQGFQSYWEKSGDASFLKKLFAQRKIKEKIKSLIEKKSIGFNLIVDFSVDNFKTLKKISNLSSNQEVNDQGLNVLFSYLFITGYLTISSSGGYKLPNEEIRYEMENKIIEYYATLYRLDFDKVQNLTNTLHAIVNSTQEEDKGLFIKNTFKERFMPKFTELIKECNFTDRRDENDGNGIFANEDASHSILNYISMQIKHAFVATEIYTQKIGSDDKGRADILVKTENTGLIIEVKHKGKAEDALDQAKTYAPLIESSRDKVFIALNITENKEVTFAVEVNIAGEEPMRF